METNQTHEPWSKCKLFGQEPPLKPKEIWAIRFHLQNTHHIRDLAMFNLAIDSKRALVCPKCSRVMLKFKIGGARPNMIDVCGHCDEAWLDEGEWQLLEALSLQNKLTAIFTEPWQRRIRLEGAATTQRRRNQKILGDEDFAELERILAWIEQHPKKSDLIRILCHEKR